MLKSIIQIPTQNQSKTEIQWWNWNSVAWNRELASFSGGGAQIQPAQPWSQWLYRGWPRTQVSRFAQRTPSGSSSRWLWVSGFFSWCCCSHEHKFWTLIHLLWRTGFYLLRGQKKHLSNLHIHGVIIKHLPRSLSTSCFQLQYLSLQSSCKFYLNLWVP